MRALRRFFNRLISVIGRKADEERLWAEMEAHLALQTAENIRAGLPPDEARRQAVIRFGAVEAIRADYRDQKGLPFLETSMQDMRYAVRSFRKAPAFTLTAVLTLALGLGATTSIFTLVYAVLLKSLPVSKPDDLYRLGKESRCCDWGGYSQTKEFSLVSHELYRHFRDNTKGFAELAAFQAGQIPLGVKRAHSAGVAQSYPGEFVSGNYFLMFGVKAFAGRALTVSDDRRDAAPVAVMSYRLWQQKYGSDPSVIGSVFNLNGNPFTLVGIAPPSFFGDSLRDPPPDFFLPLATEPLIQGESSLLYRPAVHWLDMIGRLRPSVKSASVEAEMRVELKQWLRSHWGEMDANERARFPEQTLFLSPGGAGITSMRQGYEQWLRILMMVSTFVLLIVCANVASLMLVRGMERRQQTSLSMALGAQGSRLVGQALTECILLSLTGGTAGLALAFAATRLILHFAFPSMGGTGEVPIRASPSMPILLFAFAISFLSGIIFGVAPSWMVTKADPIEALRGANRSTGRSGSLARRALVIFQSALSLVLLSASGLLTVALFHLQNQNFGFDQKRRMIVSFDPHLAGYRAEQLTPLYRRIHDSLANIPGVSSVALCGYSPLSGDNWADAVYVDGRPAPSPNENNISSLNRVTAGYFDVIGTRIVSGRGITGHDTANSQPVAVINQAFARRFFKGVNPIGKQFGRGIGATRQYVVIGVAEDARYTTYNLTEPIQPFFFLPESQYTTFPKPKDTQGDVSWHFLRDIVVVTNPGVDLSEAQIRRAMASVNPNLPVNFVRTLQEQVASQFSQQRLIAQLTSFFGLLSLALASIGVYGITAYNTGRRTKEFGVRMALGADRGNVLTLVLRDAFSLICLGLILGLPLTLAVGRVLGNQLYGVNAYNPTVLASAVAALGVSALVASLIPAVRTSSMSPLRALRAE